MTAANGFVLPLRTPSAADRAAGIFSCCSLWLADRRAHAGSNMSQTAGTLFLPNIDLYYFSKDEPVLMIACLSLLWFLTPCF